MMPRFIKMTVSCVFVLTGTALITSCSDDETSTPDEQTGITFSGHVTDAVLTTPVAEVEICAVEPAGNCATSDGDGAYTLSGLPANTDVLVSATRDGYVPIQALFIVGDADRDDVNSVMFDRQLTASIYADAGIDWDQAKGAIGVSLLDPAVSHGAAGYTASVAPSSGTGPHYIAGTALDPALTMTSATGGMAFINLDAGDYVVSTSGPGTCVGNGLLVANGNDSFPAPVKAGTLTYVIGNCPDGGGGSGGSGGAGATGGSGGAGGAAGGAGGAGG